MLAALAAVSTVFDALKSLSSSSTSASSQGTTGFTQAATSFSATATASTAATPSPSGRGSNPGKLSSDMLNDLFALLDADGSGGISKSEFETALGAGGTNTAAADDVFGKMDKDGDGSVSADEMASALSGSRRGHGHRHAGGANAGGDPLIQALGGASTTTTGNSDGSSTTTVTYADGSKVTLTSPAGTATSSTASSSYNFIEQAIQRQARAITASTTASVSA